MKLKWLSVLFISWLSIVAANAQIELGAWQCIGPFKNEAFGNVRSCLNHPFEIEKDVLHAVADGRVPDLSKTYRMEAFPGYLDLDRKWTRMDDWVDGYYNLLPRGPAPSRNESVYLYRTLKVQRKQTATIHLRMMDYYRVWLNGAMVFDNSEESMKGLRYPEPLPIRLNLRDGENQLLIKNCSRWAEHGFAFAIEGMHPVKDPYCFPPTKEDPISAKDQEGYVRAFKYGPTPIPMYSPAHLEIDKNLDALPPTPGGQAYTKALASLKSANQVAIERGALDMAFVNTQAHWSGQLSQLPPIIFITHPFIPSVSAIAPYVSKGARPSSICMLDPKDLSRPAKTIFHDPDLSIYDMSLSFDAKTIFFSACRKDGMWHCYEIQVDGTGLRQITKGNSLNISPCELPDGRIAYISSQHGTFVQCQGKVAGLLYSMNRDGTDIRLLSANIDSDHRPQVLNDGRLIFTRWDYGVEKNVFARHALWTVNPDGTKLRLYFGNTIEDPAGFWKPHPIPDRPEILCVFGPHHNFQAGMIGLVYNANGPEEPRGVGYRWINREVPVYGDLGYASGFQDPFPINEKLFLATYGGDGKSTPTRIYLFDIYGNYKWLHTAADKLGCFYPILLRERTRPPVIPSQINPVKWEYKDSEVANQENDLSLRATLLVQDVYQGISKYVASGEAKYLQVIEQVQKSRVMAGGEAWGHTPIISRGTVHVRRVLSTVPIEPDGSVNFEVPALRSISFNVLNEEGKTLMRMGSDMHMMPGEQQSCIGCHEIRESGGAGTAPTGYRFPLAASKKPYPIDLPKWGTEGIIDYIRVVQPVWDKYCVSCHSGPTPKGEVDMTSDRTRFFCQSYDHLIDRDIVDHLSVYALDHDEGTPKTVGAIVSRIDEFLSKEHCGEDMTWDERYRVYAWIDANVPYYGTYDYTTVDGEVRGIGARDSWEAGNPMKEGDKSEKPWAAKTLATVFKENCFSCHRREVFNPGWYGSFDFEVSSKIWGDKALTSHMFPKRNPLSALLGPEFRINLTNPSHSLMLQAPLAQSAGGIGLCKENGKPVFENKDDPVYQIILKAIEEGAQNLKAHPRIDMLDDEARAKRLKESKGSVDQVSPLQGCDN